MTGPGSGGIDEEPRTALRIDNLGHHYGPLQALAGISLEVRAGEIFGLLGPNGGGKTTLFRILSTVLPPSSGRVEIFGIDLNIDPSAVRDTDTSTVCAVTSSRCAWMARCAGSPSAIAPMISSSSSRVGSSAAWS
jgi:ATPase subunit of ABC transporter with duplicated ATPase domains